MNNPYSELRHFKGRRRPGRRLRRVWIIVSRFPLFLLWQILRFLPDGLGRRIRKRFKVLLFPFQSLIDLMMFWLTTRAWKHLIFALPMIAVIAWVASTMFLAKSMSQEELYKGYRKKLFNAVQGGDYKKADFMAGKLLNKSVYGRDEPMLYAAMIAAHQAGNLPRREMLRQRLTGELRSPRTHMWAASMLMADKFNIVGAVPRAIEHIKKAIELSDDEESIKGMKMQLMKIYYDDGRQVSAIQILNELGVDDHRMGVLKGKLHLKNGEKVDAGNAAMDTLNALDDDESARDKHFKVRLDALTILTDAGGDAEFVMGRLGKLIGVLEGKLALNPDDGELKPVLLQSYMIMGRLLLQREDEPSKRKGLGYLDKVLAIDDRVPPGLGRLILFASNLDASSGVISEQQIRNALVRGEGVVTGHILLGLNAWTGGKTTIADFHFRMASSHQSKTLRALEYIAMNIARRSSGMGQSPIGFSLAREPEWRRALSLLKLTAAIDKVPLGDNLKFQCLILAENQHWHEVTALLEPHIDKISGNYRIEFLKILIRANGESGNLTKAREYSQILKEEMQSIGL